MCFTSMRIAAGAVGAAVLIFALDPGFAQSVDPKAGNQRQQPTEADSQKKIDEFAEAAKLLGGPASNPECVWLGRRVVSLLWRDDLDTAFRHLELYDRFGCPSGHIQATFRCLVRQGNIDPKSPETLSARAHSCWINPTLDGTASQPSAAAAPSTTTNR
ncbi:MAG: hypothetical protein QOI12_2236 [Alphaproteobacteria bacterium]|nr:hypothetical protein [Alphaproteobacteria bacterium]